MDEQKDAFVVKTHDVQQDAEYREWIAEIRRCYRAAQTKSAVKVNAEQLLFNWQLGRDLVVRRAEEKWGKGVVEQVSLDLQEAFPGVKGFSTLYIKKWYLFYTSEAELVFSFSKQTFEALSSEKPHQISGEVNEDEKLHQVGGEVNEDEKLHQVGGEMSFPVIFGFVPWCHYVEIITMETKNIGKGAFAGTKTDAKYTCPKGKKKEYQKILKKRGASGTFTEAKK